MKPPLLINEQKIKNDHLFKQTCKRISICSVVLFFIFLIFFYSPYSNNFFSSSFFASLIVSMICAAFFCILFRLIVTYQLRPDLLKPEINLNRTDDEFYRYHKDGSAHYERNDWYNDVTNPMSPIHKSMQDSLHR